MYGLDRYQYMDVSAFSKMTDNTNPVTGFEEKDPMW